MISSEGYALDFGVWNWGFDHLITRAFMMFSEEPWSTRHPRGVQWGITMVKQLWAIQRNLEHTKHTKTIVRDNISGCDT